MHQKLTTKTHVQNLISFSLSSTWKFLPGQPSFFLQKVDNLKTTHPPILDLIPQLHSFKTSTNLFTVFSPKPNSFFQSLWFNHITNLTRKSCCHLRIHSTTNNRNMFSRKLIKEYSTINPRSTFIWLRQLELSSGNNSSATSKWKKRKKKQTKISAWWRRRGNDKWYSNLNFSGSFRFSNKWKIERIVKTLLLISNSPNFFS
jgi:hypothetical protein